MSVSVCLSVCLSARVSQKPHVRTSRNFQYVMSGAVTRSSADNQLRYVLPVLWMTSLFHIMGHMARGVSNNDVDAVLKRVVNISKRIRQWAPRFHFVVV